MVKHTKIIFIGLILALTSVKAQETKYFNHALADFQKAIELYKQESFLAAKQSFTKVRSSFRDYSEYQAKCDFYLAMSSVKLRDKHAESLMNDFVNAHPDALKRNEAILETANFYYGNGEYTRALNWYNQVDSYSLSSEQQETLWFNQGYTLFKTNQTKASKDYFQKVLQSDKYGTKAKYYYGFIAYQTDDYQEAETYLNEVSQNNTYKKNVSYYLADMSFKKGQFQKAIEQALPLLKSARNNELSEINKIIGESYFNLEKYNEALPYLLNYKGKQNKWNNTDYYQLGYCYYKQNDYNNAISQFNKIIDGQDSTAQNAYYHLAQCYLKNYKKTEALNTFKNASQMDFNKQIQEDAYLNYVKLSYDIGNPYSPVAEVIQGFLQKYPRSPEKNALKNLIVSAYVKEENYRNALAYLTKDGQNKNNLNYQKIAFYSGLNQYNKSNYDEAIIDFSESLTNPVNPDFTARATFWKAESFYQAQLYDKAQNLFYEFKRLPNASTTAEFKDYNYQMGYTYFKQRRYLEATNFFKTYIEQIPQNNQQKYQDAYLRLADVYFTQRNYESAFNSYQKIIKITPEQADYATFQSAICKGFMDKNTEKINLLNTVRTKYPDSPYTDDALYVLGTTHTTEGNTKKALEYFDLLQKEHPESQFTARSLLKKGLIYFNENNHEKAITSFKKVVEKYPNTPVAQEAIQNNRQIYLSIGKVDEYAQWAEELGYNISNSELENDTYNSAYQIFIKNNYKGAISGFKSYIKKYPKGLFYTEANFYLAQSLSKTTQKDKAFEYYKYVADLAQNDFSEPSIIATTQYYLKQDNWNNALPYLEKLEHLANHDQNRLYAQSNLMKAYYHNKSYIKAEQYADKSLNHKLADNKVKTDAQLIIARSAFKNNNMSKSKTQYKTLESASDKEIVAEALYHKAYFMNQHGDYKNSNTVVQKIASDYAGYKIWGAQALIIMAKNFYALNDAYQATYILDSVIKNFKQFPDVISQAETELSRIKQEQAKTNTSVNQD